MRLISKYYYKHMITVFSNIVHTLYNYYRLGFIMTSISLHKLHIPMSVLKLTWKRYIIILCIKKLFVLRVCVLLYRNVL